MADVIEALTNDERAILEIAATGQPMMEVGRWEKPVMALVARGYLGGGQFNRCITAAGRAACQVQEDEADRRLGEMLTKARQITTTQQEIAQMVEQAAAIMAMAALKTAEVRGDTAYEALDQWLWQLKAEAQTIIREKICAKSA